MDTFYELFFMKTEQCVESSALWQRTGLGWTEPGLQPETGQGFVF